MVQKPDIGSVKHELQYITSRSGGPGGQHVNKVSTKVTLRWDVPNSAVLSDEQKQHLMQQAKNKLTADGFLIVTSQDKRSQLQNKEEAIEKLDSLLTRLFKTRKKRKPTKPTKASKQKRMEQKKQRSEKKNWRRKV